MQERTVEYRRLRQLNPHPHNVRTHPGRKLERLAEGIKTFSFTSPVLIDENNTILAGHARVQAARLARLHRVPCIVLKGLTEAQKRAYVLFDNKITERSGYDRTALAVEIQDLVPILSEAGMGIELTGFEAAEIDALLIDLVDPEGEPADPLPALEKEAVAKRGDLWLLGKHRLLCGDACNKADVARVMAGSKARMVITDPPYNVQIRSVQGRGKTKHREFLEASGEKSSPQFRLFLRDALSPARAHSVDGSIHFVFMDWRHAGDLLAAGAEVYSELKNTIVWVKSNAGQGSFYRSQHEFIYVFKAGNEPHTNNFHLGQHGRTRSNVWNYAGVNSFKAGRMEELTMHPTVKPVALIVDAIRDCSCRGDVVLDPFMGSGTTIVAAERIGRIACGLELDPLYVDVAIRRWQAYSKKDAINAETGLSFDRTAAGALAPKKRSRA